MASSSADSNGSKAKRKSPVLQEILRRRSTPPKLFPQMQQAIMDSTTGPMWAGKTSGALHRIRQHELRKESVCVIKHAVDTRHSELMRSHDGITPNAGAITTHLDTDTLLGIVVDESVSLVIIDEVQMFNRNEALNFCREMLARGKDVHVFGLDTDYLMEPFETTAALVAMSDNHHKLKAVCSVPKCKTPAGFTARIVPSKELILVGAQDKYAACCRAHHAHLSYRDTTPVHSPREEVDVSPLRQRPMAPSLMRDFYHLAAGDFAFVTQKSSNIVPASTMQDFATLLKTPAIAEAYPHLSKSMNEVTASADAPTSPYTEQQL